MKIVGTIARYLLGLMFLVFGSNMFLHFIPMGEMPPGLAGQFTAALFAAHYFYVVGAIMVISGILLLVNRFVPLALALLGPVIVNIILYHLLLTPAGAQLAVVVTILWIFLFYRYRQYFSGIFVQKAL